MRFAVLLFVAFTLATSHAQVGTDRSISSAKEQTHQYIRHLGLDPETGDRVLRILVESAERNASLQQEMERLQAECDAIAVRNTQKLAEVLTPDQLAKLASLEAERSGKPHNRYCDALSVDGELRCCAAAADRARRTGRETKEGLEKPEPGITQEGLREAKPSPTPAGKTDPKGKGRRK